MAGMRLTNLSWGGPLSLRQVLDCTSPLALSEVAASPKAVEGYRSPRRCRGIVSSLSLSTVRWQAQTSSVSTLFVMIRASSPRLLRFLRWIALVLWIVTGDVLSPQSAVSQLPPVLDQSGTQEPVARESSSSIVSQVMEANLDLLKASGVTLTESGVGYRQTRSETEFSFTASYDTMDLDYEPADVDIISVPANLGEHRLGIQSSVRRRLVSSLTLLGSIGGYEGYSDYRSAWLNEYYRQYYSEVPGYRKAHPWGYNVSAGLRWEYRPTTSFLQVDAVYSRDNVSPGYEMVLLEAPAFGSALHHTTRTLHTTGLRLSFENILTPRLRMLNELQIADTTDRSARYSYQGSLNWAVAERWVLRSVASLSLESPDFHSFSAGATVERDWNQRWFVSLFGRYYKDNGEVENPQLINAASPALETVQAGIGLRWQGARVSWKVIAGPYLTRYALVTFGTEPFARLYRNRDWVSAQTAFAYTF
jgi:hypothetical protein